MTDHEDYAPIPISERHQAAIDLASMIEDWKLCDQPNRKGVFQSPDKRYRYVDFCVGRVLMGRVMIYSPGWVHVSYRADLPGLPRDDSRVFESVEDAAVFMRLAFVTGDPQAALKIRQRQPKEKTTKAPVQTTPPPASVNKEGVPHTFDEDYLSAQTKKPITDNPLDAVSDLSDLFGDEE